MVALEKIKIDSIVLGLVPKIVERVSDLPLKTDDEFINYSDEQVTEFFNRIPREIKGEVKKTISKNEKSVLAESNSTYQLIMQSSPGINCLYSSRKNEQPIMLYFPRFSLGFKNLDKDNSTKIIKVSLDRFFLEQSDIDNGTLIAVGIGNKKVVYRDLELLEQFLEKGTEIQSRINWGAGIGEATYVIGHKY